MSEPQVFLKEYTKTGLYPVLEAPDVFDQRMYIAGCCEVEVAWDAQDQKLYCSKCYSVFTESGAEEVYYDWALSFRATKDELTDGDMKTWLSAWTGIPEDDLVVDIRW